MNTNHSLKVPLDSLLGKVVCKNYLIVSKINEGSFGEVYKAIHLIKQDYYAVKIEAQEIRKKRERPQDQKLKFLKNQMEKRKFQDYTIILRIKLKEYLWKPYQNLDELYILCNYKFSLKTVLLFMEQAISRLEYLHSQVCSSIFTETLSQRIS